MLFRTFAIGKLRSFHVHHFLYQLQNSIDKHEEKYENIRDF